MDSLDDERLESLFSADAVDRPSFFLSVFLSFFLARFLFFSFFSAFAHRRVVRWP